MTIKNIGRKIIGFGSVSALPGQVTEISDSYKSNPVIDAYKALGIIEVVEKTAAKKGAKKRVEEEAVAADNVTEEATISE